MTATLTSASRAPAAARVRRARPSDIPALAALIRHYSEQGILLPRSEQDLRKAVADFRIIAEKRTIIACAVLRLYTPKVAELRSLAVAPERRGAGLGRRIVAAILREARARNLDMVFAFTYEVDFFARAGFAPIDRALVPWKAWRDCRLCPKQDCCDEIAVARWLKAPEAGTKHFAPAFPILNNHNIL
ncbi:MAG TPA: GNAT family N-acetyltransferase [Bryobacterales bacterium]|nr:GNAT family N-acetyltransferase [Bryobacterales bacterium]